MCGRGEVAQALTLGREGLALVRDVGDLRFCAAALDLLAGTAGMAGQGRRAARLLGAVAAVRTVLGEDAWMVAYVAGHALTPEQAITEALDEAG
jgi:hypothetical protein